MRFNTQDPDLDRSLQKVLFTSIPSTFFFIIIQGSAYTAFVRALSRQDSLYGFLAALPLIAGIFRLLSAFLIEKFHRRREVFLIALYTQRLSWIPFALIPYLIPSTEPRLRIVLAVLCLSLHGAGGAIGDVAFISWLTDLVPAEIRGSYLGQRNRLGQITAMLTPLVVGWYLDRFPGFFGLSTALIAAAISGVADISIWLWVKHPAMKENTPPLPLKEMLFVPLRLLPYRKLLFFWATALFAFGLAGPFFMVYVLEVLNFSYTEASIQLQVLPGIMAFLLSRFLGRSIDEYGSKPLLRLCMSISTSLPLFWLISTPRFPWPQLLANLLGGVTWIGLDMAQMSLMMKILPQEKRSFYIAGYGLTAWLAGNATGSMFGGFLADRLRPLIEGNGLRFLGAPLTVYQVIFFFSFILRFLVLTLILPRIEEPEAKSTREVLASLRRNARQGRSFLQIVKKTTENKIPASLPPSEINLKEKG
ncbi:MAG: MFS transporter [Firmicutes bacterium]|nr:MFS transporter [Bacillota bacterium]